MINKPKKVLAFAREAGGAEAIAPVCKAMLQEGWELLLLAKDYGLNIFENRRLNSIDFPKFDTENLNILIKKMFGSLPDLIFTSATSLPTLDMTEKYLWKWGQKRRILTIGLLDQWQNYALRFSGADKNERLAYLPDYIFAMDQLAKDEMINDGIPEERIIVTGQPAFDKIIDEQIILSSQMYKIKDKLNISQDSTIITFVAESLKRDFGNRLGYDELSTLLFLGNSIEEFCRQDKKLKIFLIIRLHPENECEEFNWAVSNWSFFKLQIIRKELSSSEVIAITDIVVGMISVMLLEAIVANKITVSLQINSVLDSQLVATKVGAIPFIKTQESGKQILNLLLYDKKYKKKYIEKQQGWKICRNAAKNCLEILKSM